MKYLFEWRKLSPSGYYKKDFIITIISEPIKYNQLEFNKKFENFSHRKVFAFIITNEIVQFLKVFKLILK